MKSLTLVDGRESGFVPITDRGLQYGDGLFETMAVRGGSVRLLAYHLSRLRDGCERLGISLPGAGLDAEIAGAARHVGHGVLKLILTRGDGPRGYAPPRPNRPRRLLTSSPWPQRSSGLWTHGVAVRVCTTRVGNNPSLAGIKHLNRLEQVLARAEWDDPAVSEGLMLDGAGNVICATAANLFLVSGGELITPSLDRAGVAGVMRRVVIEAARACDIAVRECAVPLERAQGADELMLTSSLVGIWPVRQLGGRVLAVGGITRRLSAELARRGVM